MALAEGLLSGGQNIMAFNQQRKENQMAQSRIDEQTRQYDETFERNALESDRSYVLAQQQADTATNTDNRAQELHAGAKTLQGQTITSNQITLDDANRTARNQKGDAWIAGAIHQGWLSATDYSSLDIAKSIEMVKAGGQRADTFILDMAMRDKDIPEGFTLDTVDRTTGKIILSGSYEDGRKGVFTVDGKVSNDAEVMGLSPEELVSLMDDEYAMNIVGNSNMGKTSELAQMLIGAGVGKADAEQTAIRLSELATLQTKVVGAIDATANKAETPEEKTGMKRSFRAALASAKTKDEKLEILIDQAELMQIEIPPNLIKSNDPVDESSVESRLAKAGITPDRWEGMSDQEKAAALKSVKDASTSGILIKNQTLPAEGRDEYFRDEGRRASAGVYQPDASVTAPPAITMAQAKGSFTAIAEQSEAAKTAAAELEAGLFSQIDGMSPAEVVEYIKGGGFKSTPEDEQKLSTVLQDAKIKTIDDFAKLPSAAQINARAWLMAIAPTPAIQNQMAKEIVNLGGGGSATASTLEQSDAQVKQRDSLTKEQTAATGVANAKTSRRQLLLDTMERLDKVEGDDFTRNETDMATIETAFGLIADGIYILDDDGKPTDDIKFTERRFFNAMSGLNGGLTKLQTLLGSASAQRRPAIRKAVNSAYSMGIQVLAESEEFGTMGEILPDGSIDFIDGNDAFLARVFVSKRNPANGQPMRFGIRSLSSLNQVEETIPASKVLKLFGNQGYADFRRQLANRATDEDANVEKTGLGK